MRIGRTVKKRDRYALDIRCERREVVALRFEPFIFHLDVSLRKLREAIRRNRPKKVLNESRVLPGNKRVRPVALAIGVTVRGEDGSTVTRYRIDHDRRVTTWARIFPSTSARTSIGSKFIARERSIAIKSIRALERVGDSFESARDPLFETFSS